MKFLQCLFHDAIRIISAAFLSGFYYTIWLYLYNFISEGFLSMISITFCVPGTPSSYCWQISSHISHVSQHSWFFLISKLSVKILEVLRLVFVEPPHPSTAPFQCNLSSSLRAVPHCFTVCWLISIFFSLPFNQLMWFSGTEWDALLKSSSWDRPCYLCLKRDWVSHI